MKQIDLFFEAVTALGDSGFILPAAGGLALVLLAAKDRRSALAFSIAVGACGALAAAAKVVCMIHDGFAERGAIHSPSGHAAMATVFFASLGLFAIRSNRPGRGWTSAVVCAVLVALIAFSRVWLHAHTWQEALVGLAIGLFSFSLVWAFGSRRSPIDRRALVAYSILVVALHAAFGIGISIESRLERIAERIGPLLRN
jgi:membrane-associated phospholipid phosphatase